MRTEYRRDQRGNLVMQLNKNAAEAGAPARPRGWIKRRSGYDGLDRLVSSKVDQAPVDAAAEDLLETTYAYQPDHRLLAEDLPTGATNLYSWDGYKLLFKKTCDAGSGNGEIALVPQQLYYDRDGLLVLSVNGEGEATTIELTPTGLVQRIIDPTGSGDVFIERDSLLRVAAVSARVGISIELVELTTRRLAP